VADHSSSSTLATANAIRRSLADFARRMRALREDHGVSASKLSLLGRLHRTAGPTSATELARFEKLQPQSLTRIIAELESEGFIERKQNASDRRQLDIQLLAKGAELLIQDARRQNEWLTAAMEHQMTSAERAVLAVAAEILDRIGRSEIQPATTEPRSSRF
jgi:DNA-binding MarR family transcriptional regulator